MAVNFRFQIRWIANTALIAAFASSMALFLLQRALNRQLGLDYGEAFYSLRELERGLYLAVSLPVLLYLVLAGVLVVFFKLFISHKIAGPLYRLEMCASALAGGDYRFSTKLRKGDQLNGLAAVVGELRDHLQGPIPAIEGGLQRAEALLRKIGVDAGRVGPREICRDLELFEEELSRLAAGIDEALGASSPAALQSSSDSSSSR